MTEYILFYIGLGLGLAVIAGIVVIFVYLVKKQETIKKLPKWVYILAGFLLVFALASIALVITGGAMYMANESARKAAEEASQTSNTIENLLYLL